jgi:hypothetical protein
MQHRNKLMIGATLAIALALTAITTTAMADTTTHRPTTAIEQDQLQVLHKAAKAEGCKVTVYIGGDAPGQWDSTAAAFHQQFPDVRLHLFTDLSKYQDARIDNQLATGHLVAVAVILQTTQDFDRWKKRGDLLPYQPVLWDKALTNAKHKDGYCTGVFYGAFSYLVNTKQLPGKPSGLKATDLLKPAFDDAVLFGYKQIVDKYSWNYLAQLAKQNPKLIRGVPGPAAGVANGDYLASVAVGGDTRPNGTQVFSNSERFRSQVELYFGQVKGADPGDPDGTLGRTPGAF